MARIHARRRGSSGSRRPLTTEAPKWQGLSKKEVKDKIVQLAKEGHTTARIGLILRDAHAVPSVHLATGQSISKILEEAKLAPKLPEDITNLIKKVIRLDEHLQEKRNDLHNKRSLHLNEAKIRRLARYYKSTGKLAPEWSYSLKNAKLLVE
ncbi:MAG: 30S ribosomal protein S15 [Euryarchaeota archaeon]|nr:30S ribosomal protein S15 [Euryarchaeota archaeon]